MYKGEKSEIINNVNKFFPIGVILTKKISCQIETVPSKYTLVLPDFGHNRCRLFTVRLSS